MTGYFVHLLESIVKNPSQKISKLKMLSAIEEEQILKTFNDTQVEYPRDKSIIDLFEAQAIKTPGAVALLYKQEELTYKELNERSNQLAHYLRSRGVKEEVLVPICIERSLEMITGILGILKAGGAYVPIDPEYPADRIKYMLKDTSAAVIVSSKAVRARLPGSHEGVEIIEIDTIWEEISKEPVKDLQINISPYSLAYVIYTSGSTGKPKGVMIEHQAVLDHCFGLIKSAGLEKCKSFALFAPLVFDAGHAIIFSSLFLGASLHVLSKELIIEGDRLADYLERRSVDCVKIVPSVWLSYIAGNNIVLGNNVMIFGGEGFSVKIQEQLKKLNYKGDVYNHYGPTEATIGKTIHKVNLQKKYITVPIGRPFSNTKLYIVDQRDQLVPFGVAGELYISGEGIARGYLNRPELTAEKFIKDPFSAKDGYMLYKTGDKAKWNAEGEIEYLGRIDEQVKIRGHRIELGEIENELAHIEGVKHGTVATIDDNLGNKILVGYIVARGSFNKEAIITRLRSKLPEYMIPLIWIEIEELPLTSNGKVNKKALPHPGSSLELTREYTAPRNETEEKLSAIWQGLLEIEKVSTQDNFFELGGHSLLAMRLVSAVRRNLSVEIPVKSLFLYPTIAQLANYLQGRDTEALLPVIEVKDRPENIPISYSQERLWFIDQLEGSVQYHIPAVLRMRGKLDSEALRRSFGEIVNRHEVLRSVFYQQEDGKVCQRIKEKDQWELNISTDIFYKEDAVGLGQYIQQLSQAPFDLSRDYMLRATLLRLGEEEHLLLVVMHHIASDGWSSGLIIKEAASLYESYSGGLPVDLVPLGLQYADYAVWQRNYLQGEVLANKIKYWKEKLDGVAVLELPVDYPRAAIQSTRGSAGKFSITKQLTDQLNLLCQEKGATLFMVLLAAYKILLHRYSGQEDICVGTPVANRGQQEIEGLIGFFVNTLALRSGVSGGTTFIDFLDQVKATTIEAYGQQDVPFEKVVEAVVRERDLSRSQLFQAMLVLQNTPDAPELQLGALQLSVEAVPSYTSKFELTFSITETGGRLEGLVEYNTDLYREDTIERMTGYFVHLLESIVKNPSQKISKLKMLSAIE
ncbi:MAG: amino acid adenylation domain-containing protein, partial [Taibaiella sp.]|nr:amino acid adenylation domain-containing protein [Taibaiella sp.]